MAQLSLRRECTIVINVFVLNPRQKWLIYLPIVCKKRKRSWSGLRWFSPHYTLSSPWPTRTINIYMLVCMSRYKGCTCRVGVVFNVRCLLSRFKAIYLAMWLLFMCVSDNSTNFVGAKVQLDEMYNLLVCPEFKSKFNSEYVNRRIHRKIIPPRSPYFGGMWHSINKSFKTHLSRVIGSQLDIRRIIYSSCSD